MPDMADGGDLTQGLRPTGGEPDPNAAPDGGDQTHGGPPAGERWDDESFRRERLNAMHKTGYGKGRQKGQQEGVANLLKSFGLGSIEELRARLDPEPEEPAQQIPQTQPAAALTQPTQAPAPEAESRAMREARLARQKLERDLEAERQAKSVLEARSNRALRGELKSRLVQAGAHEGVDELVTLLVEAEGRFGWAADGQDIIALDRQDDGTSSESNETVDEVIAEIAKKRPWYFRAAPTQGSGYQGTQKPAQRPASSGYDFRRNFSEWQSRRGR